jgi:hypothetical protein
MKKPHNLKKYITFLGNNDQATLLAEFAAEQHINFLDLTPYFLELIGEGEELYYPYDTHWNQSGNDLAVQTIGMYIADMFGH